MKRQASHPPHWAPLLALPATVLAVFAAIVWAHWPWLEKALAVEEAPIAWLQSSMLWLSAGLALLLAIRAGAELDRLPELPRLGCSRRAAR